MTQELKDELAKNAELLKTEFFSLELSEEQIRWLTKNGFFTAPCSTKYHLCEKGGLLTHSIHVADELCRLTDELGLVWQRDESPVIVGIFHDLCKADQYIYDPVRKCYKWNSDQAIEGHGDKSVKLIEDKLGIHLTDEERACIRWHMGAFDTKENWTNYCNAIHDFPNVLYTHTADMIATHIVEHANERSEVQSDAGKENTVN